MSYVSGEREEIAFKTLKMYWKKYAIHEFYTLEILGARYKTSCAELFAYHYYFYSNSIIITSHTESGPNSEYP